MFTLKAEGTFTWPVKAKAPEDGKYVPVNFEATFRVLSQKQITDYAREGEGAAVRTLEEALISFEGIDIVNAEGEKVSDDDDRREIILVHPYMVKALSDAFASGIAGHRIKN